MPRHDTCCKITVPDLGFENVAMTLSVWLVPRQAEVTAGDRIVEILAGDVTVDLPAPATGILVEQCVPEDDPIQPGQILGFID